jgi:hypothetical protein
MTKNKEDREPVTPLMIVLAIIFVLKYALL